MLFFFSPQVPAIDPSISSQSRMLCISQDQGNLKAPGKGLSEHFNILDQAAAT